MHPRLPHLKDAPCEKYVPVHQRVSKAGPPKDSGFDPLIESVLTGVIKEVQTLCNSLLTV